MFLLSQLVHKLSFSFSSLSFLLLHRFQSIWIFLIFILITISGYSTLGNDNINLKNVKIQNIIQINHEIPTWDVGDYWKYEIDDLIIESEDMGLNINIEINDFIVEVIEDLGDSFNFGDISKRRKSPFNLQRVEFWIDHKLCDWNLTFKYTGVPVKQTFTSNSASSTSA